MDPEVVKTLQTVEWRQSLTGFLVRFGIITAIFIGIMVFLLISGSMFDITNSWSRYRCNPLIIPIAELFGYDSAENFQYCVRALMEDQSSEFFQPIYTMLSQYSSSLGQIINTVNGFRKMLGNFKLSTDGFVKTVMAKIQAMMFQIRMTFMKMQTLMGRVYGTMYSIIWMGTSAITAGLSLGDNDLVNFMFEFCFAPETPLRLQDGSLKPIKDIQVGDVLEGNVRVTSTLIFNGSKTPMVQIGADQMSAEHRVFLESSGQWIPASQHPAALPTPSLPVLYCLNVEGHAFHTAAGLLVADYDESEDPQAIADVKRIAERGLNGLGETGGTVGVAGAAGAAGAAVEYSLGFDPSADIRMVDESWKPAQKVNIGDVLYGGATVCGLVKEWSGNVKEFGGLQFTASQLLYINNTWQRVETLSQSKPIDTPSVLVHFITDRAAPLFLRSPNNPDSTPIAIRDYREAPLPEMEDPYLSALSPMKI